MPSQAYLILRKPGGACRQAVSKDAKRFCSGLVAVRPELCKGPAKAGIHVSAITPAERWVPAFAGMAETGLIESGYRND